MTRLDPPLLLTIADPDSEPINNRYEFLHDPPENYKGAYDYKLKIHIDVVEDLLFLHGGGRDAPPNRKPRREFIWSYGALDSLGERREGHQEDNHHAYNDYRPRRNDPDDDHRRGTRRPRSSSAWSRVSRCRGVAADCYSSTQFRGGRRGQSSYRSRRLTPPPSWGHGSSPRLKSKPMWVAKTKKKVSFAYPIASVFGSAEDTPADPTKEDYIMQMLSSPGWEPVASPMVRDELEEGEWRKPEEVMSKNNTDDMTNACNDEHFTSLSYPMQKLPRPFNKDTMEALQILVEHGNKPKGRKKTKIAPAPVMEQPMPVI